MRRLPNRMMPHGGLVVVEALRGHGVNGPVFAAPVTPPRAAIQGSRDLITSEVIATARVWLDPEQAVPEGSRIRIWVGTPRERLSTVEKVTVWDHAPLPSYVELQVK